MENTEILLKMQVVKDLNSEFIDRSGKILGRVSDSPYGSLIDINYVSKSSEVLDVVSDEVNDLQEVSFDPKNNKIHFKLDSIKERDIDLLLAKGLILVSMSRNNTGKLGLAGYNVLKPLHQGILDNIAESAVGNENHYVTPYDDEKIIARLFEKIYGTEVILGSFLKSSPDMFLNKAGIKHYGEIVESEVLVAMYDNMQNRHDTKKSNLGEIEMQLIDLFFNKEDLTKEQVADFNLYLTCRSEQFLANQNMYKSVDNVQAHFDNVKANKLGKQL